MIRIAAGMEQLSSLCGRVNWRLFFGVVLSSGGGSERRRCAMDVSVHLCVRADPATLDSRPRTHVRAPAGTATTWGAEQSSKHLGLPKGKGSPYSIAQRRVPELIPVLCSQRADYVSHKPGGSLPLLSARPAVTPAIIKRDASNFAAC